LTRHTFIQTYPQYSITGEWICDDDEMTNKDECLCRCNVCGHTQKIKQTSLLKNKKKPVCNNCLKLRHWTKDSYLLLQMCLNDKKLYTNGKPDISKIAICMNRDKEDVGQKITEYYGQV
jgi:hypothetical protein